MSLIQSFRALTASPLQRMSPMEDDPHSPLPSANKLYFPASIYFGNLAVLPGAEEVEYPERDLADKLVRWYTLERIDLEPLTPICQRTGRCVLQETSFPFASY